MTARIFRSVIFTALISTLLALGLMVATFFSIYEVDMTRELRTEAGYIVYALERTDNETTYFEGFSSKNRVTLIAPDGEVLYDSSTEASALDNHALRPEVMSALQTGTGEVERYSDTLAQTTHYYAVRTHDGNVLRVASTRSTALGMLLKAMPLLGVALAVVVLFSLVIARLSARSIVAPINALNLNTPLENDIYDELTPLLQRMDAHRRARDAARQELTTIMENMHEGLVLLDYQGTILAISGSAAEVLGMKAQEHLGKDMLSINVNPAVGDAVYTALTGHSAHLGIDWQDRKYQLLANPVRKGNRTEGAVLMVLDMTEHYAAERSRREFTANVSHELKTPLTSISGYAEIIRDGVARSEDIQNFAGRIHQEAGRLLSLINDILALSRLDERRGLGAREQVSLLAAAQEAVGRMEYRAKGKNIALQVVGEDMQISAYPVLLGEMLLNLVDNAVKYTPEGGSVDVQLEQAEDTRVLRVRDTGIGIPASHQAHIFERFYRVDKSHSRSTGGTGLGLSIVKHGAEVHNAAIRIDSEVGRGTCIELRFPPPDAGDADAKNA